MLRIKPLGSKSKCGILNRINSMPNSSEYIKVVENIHSDSFSGSTKTLVNCSTTTNWASKTNEAHVDIQLFKHRILPTHVSLSRRLLTEYAKKAALQGHDLNGWQTICTVDIEYEGAYDTNVKECKGKRYYSDFRITQVENSKTFQYLELSNMDIFGYYMSESSYFMTSRCESMFRCMMYFINILLSII